MCLKPWASKSWSSGEIGAGRARDYHILPPINPIYSYGKAAEAYLQMERSAQQGQPEVLMLGLEMRIDRSV